MLIKLDISLNTSYVKVNRIDYTKVTDFASGLNTSYVKVNLEKLK